MFVTPGNENIFVGEIAPHYDDDSTGVSHPSVVEPTVDFLVSLAGEGRRWSSPSGRAASACR